MKGDEKGNLLTIFCLVIACLNVFMSDTCYAQKQEKKITLKKMEFQPPIPVLESYAELLLLREVAFEAIDFDWNLVPYVKAEHQNLIENKIRKKSDIKLTLKNLNLVKLNHDKDNFYFYFSFSKPKFKTIVINDEILRAALLQVDTKTTFMTNIHNLEAMLTYDRLITLVQLKKKWKEVFPFYSFDTVFLKSQLSAEEMRFSNTTIRDKDLPSSLEEAFLLFDLAPLNSQACENILDILGIQLAKIKKIVSEHCKKLSKDSQINDEEIKELTIDVY